MGGQASLGSADKDEQFRHVCYQVVKHGLLSGRGLPSRLLSNRVVAPPLMLNRSGLRQETSSL